MGQVLSKLEGVAEDLNLLLNEKFVSTGDIIVTSDGSLSACDINIGYLYYSKTGRPRPFYEKTGLQKLLAKFYCEGNMVPNRITGLYAGMVNII